MFIVITKTVGDIEKPSKLHKNLPGYYPLECKEFKTYEEARAAYPVAQIMPIQGYKAYHESLEEIYREAKTKALKPWYKFF